MVTLEQVREITLGLPEAEETPHHDLRSFRVGGRIFATIPDAAHLNVMIADDEIRRAIAMSKRAVAELWWGTRLSGVTVDLGLASRTVVAELLGGAWRRRAPEGTGLPPLPPVEVIEARRRVGRGCVGHPHRAACREAAEQGAT